MMKLGRYSGGFLLIERSLYQSLDALHLFGGIFTVLCIAFGSTLYIVERGDYNEETGMYEQLHMNTEVKGPSAFQSVPDAMWFCIVTFSTVGYGDISPITWAGYLVGIAAQLTGVILLALPLSILGATFHEERARIQEEGTSDEEEEEHGAIDVTGFIGDMQEEHMQVLERAVVAISVVFCAQVELIKIALPPDVIRRHSEAALTPSDVMRGPSDKRTCFDAGGSDAASLTIDTESKAVDPDNLELNGHRVVAQHDELDNGASTMICKVHGSIIDEIERRLADVEVRLNKMLVHMDD